MDISVCFDLSHALRLVLALWLITYCSSGVDRNNNYCEETVFSAKQYPPTDANHAFLRSAINTEHHLCVMFSICASKTNEASLYGFNGETHREGESKVVERMEVGHPERSKAKTNVH